MHLYSHICIYVAFLRDCSKFNACEKVGLFAPEKIAPVEYIQVKCDFIDDLRDVATLIVLRKKMALDQYTAN